MYQVLLSQYSRIFYNEWKLKPDRSDYNIVFDHDLFGNIDVLRLQNAIQRFISDNVILNSHIKNQGDDLYWVKNSQIYQLEFVEQDILNKDICFYIQQPFNLEKGPLYRFRLIQKSYDNYRLIIVFLNI